MIWVVIATGQSLRREDVDYLKDKPCRVVVVSNAYELAPWADVLISCDAAWWEKHPQAKLFDGIKLTRAEVGGVDRYNPDFLPRGCNSGLAGMFVARGQGASKILLLGFDMHGTHYFGPHPEGLKNTSKVRFAQHLDQFARFDGCDVINCTPGSALKRYPMANIRDVI